MVTATNLKGNVWQVALLLLLNGQRSEVASLALLIIQIAFKSHLFDVERVCLFRRYVARQTNEQNIRARANPRSLRVACPPSLACTHILCSSVCPSPKL